MNKFRYYRYKFYHLGRKIKKIIRNSQIYKLFLNIVLLLSIKVLPLYHQTYYSHFFPCIKNATRITTNGGINEYIKC